MTAEILPIRRNDEAVLWRVFVSAFEAYEAEPTEDRLRKDRAYQAFKDAYCGRAVA
jgi:hypothetical protein